MKFIALFSQIVLGILRLMSESDKKKKVPSLSNVQIANGVNERIFLAVLTEDRSVGFF